MAELATESLIGFSAGMSLRSRLEQVFSSGGHQPDFTVFAQTIESICALVQSGCGAAIIHPYAEHVARMRGLATATLAGSATLELSVVTPEAPRRARFVDDFADAVARLFADQHGGREPRKPGRRGAGQR